MKNRFAGPGLLCAASGVLIALTAGSGGAAPPQRTERMRCESIDGRRNVCEANIRGNVRISRQLSDKECIEGRNWGWNSRGVWVDNGCRAEFEFETQQRPGWGGGYGSGNTQQIRCESIDGRRNFCAADIRGEVRIRRQISNRACVEGRNWGWNAQGIWVDNGCRADFEYVEGSGGRGRGERGRGGWGGDDRGRRSYVQTCESDNNRYRECRLDRPSDVRLGRQLSDARCERNRSWGLGRNERSIWVNHGCRAEFEVTPK